MELPATAEVRLRAMNIGQLVFELAPQDPLAKKYRELADMIYVPAIAKARTKQTANSSGFLDKLKSSLKGN